MRVAFVSCNATLNNPKVTALMSVFANAILFITQSTFH